ncbi:MAG: hypothetical protein HOD54_02835 [Candidatus Magasanikbacteria bacterium]|nr:hypothetical protein [Candidatus Magasanikbacteria bacterium]
MHTKRRRKPNRWAEFDYNSPAFYFVTICTARRQLFFGKIENEKMILNKFGQIAQDCWLDALNHFRGIELGEFIVMPNHVHCIVVITGDGGVARNGHAHSLRDMRSHQKLPTIIGSYKSAVTKKINKLGINITFGWQKSYYDHIIRNEKSYYNIQQYIMNNPANWVRDRNNIF